MKNIKTIVNRSPEQVFINTITCEFAEYHSRVRSARIKAGLAERKKAIYKCKSKI